MRASWGSGGIQGDRLVGAIVIAADLAVWTLVVPGRALLELLPA